MTVGACLIIAVVTVILVLVFDRRLTAPGVEGQMIKEFNSIPASMSKDIFKKLAWHQDPNKNKWEPFPLYDLITNKTISIDEAFPVQPV